MLKPEEILGKMYQPVDSKNLNNSEHVCFKCELYNHDDKARHPCGASINGVSRCFASTREDNLDIYYINIEGE